MPLLKRATSSLSPVRRPGLSACARSAGAHRAGAAEVHGQCFAAISMSAVALGVCHGSLRIVADPQLAGGDGISSSGHTLRFYIRPHCVKCSPVSREAPLVAPTASRPAGLRSGALCKVAYAGPGLSAVGAARSLARPTRRQLSPSCRAGTWVLVRRCAHHVGQWPAAMYLVFAPAHPWASPLRGIGPARVCPSAPHGGSLSTAPGVRVKRSGRASPFRETPLTVGFHGTLVGQSAKNFHNN